MKCLKQWTKFLLFIKEKSGIFLPGTYLLFRFVCVGFFTCVASGLLAQNPKISGSWRGELDLGIQKIPLIMNFQTHEAMDKDSFDIHSFEELNHLFQAAPTGAVSEYGEIEETMNEPMLEKLATWILQLPTNQPISSP